MITIERAEEVFRDTVANTITKDFDYEVKAITLLRERIPYEKCKSIIATAQVECLQLCYFHTAAPYLSEDDLQMLADCNVGIDFGNEYFILPI